MLKKELVNRAKTLRNMPTPAETILWDALRKRQLHGVKFRRQHLMDGYIVDFICCSHRLIIEVDGKQHHAQVEYDTIRSDFLHAGGYQVLRFWNDEVVNRLDQVLGKIQEALLRAEVQSPRVF